MHVGLSEVITPPGGQSGASTRTEVRSPTSTEVRSPTRTATEVRSPTSTSTEAYTQGNFTATVTGGAGAGATTTVHIHAPPVDRPNTATSNQAKSGGPRMNAQENPIVGRPTAGENADVLHAKAGVGETPAQAAGNSQHWIHDWPVQGPTDPGMRAADCWWMQNVLRTRDPACVDCAPSGCQPTGALADWGLSDPAAEQPLSDTVKAGIAIAGFIFIGGIIYAVTRT